MGQRCTLPRNSRFHQGALDGSSRLDLLGGILAALAVTAGAFRAHGLEARLDPAKASTPEEAANRQRQLENFKTAAEYQMYAAIGIVLAGVIAAQRPSKWTSAGGVALLLGIVLFSGGLYAWVLTEQKFFVMIVPIGGTAFIVGWVLLAIGGLSIGRSHSARNNVG